MKAVLIGLAFAIGVLAGAQAQDQAEAPRIEQEVVTKAAPDVLAEVRGAPVRIAVRRYSSSSASDAAYKRLEAALAGLAQSGGVHVASEGETAAFTVEVDATFYVYTDKFNARLVRLAEYTEAQMANAGAAPTVTADNKTVDVLRVAAGALGIVRGWISPSFGSYMIGSGTGPALFGSGKAPSRLPSIAGRERFARGEQEVNTKIRLLREGAVVGMFGVRSWTQGDEAPFRIDELVSENWSTVFGVLAGGQLSGAQARR